MPAALEFRRATTNELAAFAGELALDADHYQLAADFLARAERESGAAPVFDLGALWQYDTVTRLWRARSLEAVAADIGAAYPGYKLCRRGTDYRQIAALVSHIAAADQFFLGAPVGIAAAGEFWRVDVAGEICREPLMMEHRQRMEIASAPLFDADAPLFDGLLNHAFGVGEAALAQRELLQMAMGAALTRQLWRHRAAILLYGPTSTGKSTWLEVFASFVPRDLVGATSPQKWESEYYVAALAGKMLNLVGELDPHTPIPGGPFKQVTGGDVLEGRHPTHRPFSFVCEAGHIFNANRLPPTRDKSDAFFRRWRIIEFRNPIPVGKEITGLAARIIADEAGAVLGWLLQGGAMLAKRGSLPETDDHRRLVEHWRAANNSALQFLLDAEYCEPVPSHAVRAADVFDTYRKWAADCGLKPMGRNAFYESVEEGAGRVGMRIYENRDGIKTIAGVSLLKG